jgi:hypothetical protein
MASAPINPTALTPPRVELIDPRTGAISREWYRFFLSLLSATQTNQQETSTAPDTSALLASYDAMLADLAQEVQSAPDAASAVSSLSEKVDDLSQAFGVSPQPPLGTMASVQQDNARFIGYSTAPSPPVVYTPGVTAWNIDDGTLDLGLYGGAVLKIGQQTLYYAKNTSGSSIPIGTPVMFTGVVGSSGKLTFGLAVADGSVPPEYMMGVTKQTIANNDFGYIVDFGLVRGFNTTGAPYGETWSDGDLLYFDPATPGTWTNVEPVAPNIHVPVAVVVNAATSGSGSIFVRMTQSERLGELQDVRINGVGPAAGQVLIYDATQQRWENNTLTAGSNVTITNGDGSITIAASDQFVGTVTSVSGTGTVNGITLTGTVTSSGSLTLGGTLSGVSLTTQVTGTLPVGNGGTGATTLTGYVKGNGTSAFTASSTIPASDVTGLATVATSGSFADLSNKPGIRSNGQNVISASTTLGAGDKGTNILIVTSGITITFPSTGYASGEGVVISNISGGNVTLSAPGGSDFGTTLPNDGTFFAFCDGGGFWRQYCYSTSRL